MHNHGRIGKVAIWYCWVRQGYLSFPSNHCPPAIFAEQITGLKLSPHVLLLAWSNNIKIRRRTTNKGNISKISWQQYRRKGLIEVQTRSEEEILAKVGQAECHSAMWNPHIADVRGSPPPPSTPPSPPSPHRSNQEKLPFESYSLCARASCTCRVVGQRKAGRKVAYIDCFVHEISPARHFPRSLTW